MSVATSHVVTRFASRLVNRTRRVFRPARFAQKAVREDDAEDVTWLNLEKTGWFNNDAHELVPGFAIGAGDVMVDVGCGPGHACLFAAQHGADVIGLDVDPAAIKQFGRRMGDAQAADDSPVLLCRAIQSDCNPIPLPAESADIVTAMEVLEHVDDPSQVLAEMVRIGKPGSRYLITVPDPVGEAVNRKIAPPAYWSKPNHLRVFGRDEFQQVVAASGLVIEQRFFYGFYWSMWWLLYWAVPNAHFPFGTSGGSPILRNWNRTWKALLSSPDGQHVWKALEEAMPKSQAIIARKTN